jgi:hypothetical protein
MLSDARIADIKDRNTLLKALEIAAQEAAERFHIKHHNNRGDVGMCDRGIGCASFRRAVNNTISALQKVGP